MHTSQALKRFGQRSNLNKLRNKPSTTRKMSLLFQPRRTYSIGLPIPRNVYSSEGALQPSLFSMFDDTFRELSKWADEHSQALTTSFGSTSFVPKFDLKETDDAYVLEGELPGIRQQDVTVEFVDDKTMVVRGRTETVREEGTKPAEMDVNITVSESSDAAKVVEEKQAEAQIQPETSVAEAASPAAEKSVTPTDVAETAIAKAEDTKKQPTYWVMERSIGQFERVFSFPAKVDHDAVKASLKDGMLRVNVPKVKDEDAGKRKVEISTEQE